MNTHIASRIIRYSWGILFLWFGTQQLLDTQTWISYLPEWTGYFPIPGEMLIHMNGWFEIVAAIALLFGIYTRICVYLLTAHLLIIAFEMGGAIGMRDATLAVMGTSLLFLPEDPVTIDAKYKKN